MPRKYGMFRSALAGFGQGVRLGRKAFPVIKAGLGMVRKFRNSSSSLRSSKQRKVTGQTTFQEDYRTLYRRKRAPRRIRRRARRSFQRFTYHLDKTQGMTSSVINNFYSASTNPTSPLTGSQGVHAISMYGCTGSTLAADFNSDLWKIYTDATGASPTGSLASASLRFRSCIMDFLIKNTGETPMFIEIYQCVARRNGSSSDASVEWASMLAKEGSTGVGTALTDVSAYKVTPFDAPGFGSYWYVKSRKRFYISGGNSVAWQIRDPKNYVITGEEIQKAQTLRNVTESCIIIGYGADVAPWTGTNDNIGIPTSCSYDVNCVKTYHWTLTDRSTDNAGYAIFT